MDMVDVNALVEPNTCSDSFEQGKNMTVKLHRRRLTVGRPADTLSLLLLTLFTHTV